MRPGDGKSSSDFQLVRVSGAHKISARPGKWRTQNFRIIITWIVRIIVIKTAMYQWYNSRRLSIVLQSTIINRNLYVISLCQEFRFLLRLPTGIFPFHHHQSTYRVEVKVNETCQIEVIL